jgi:hypothetical protein
VAYLARVRSGFVRRRTPVSAYVDHEPVVWTLQLDPKAFLAVSEVGKQEILDQADRVHGGQIRFFGGGWRDVGVPPRWHVNPITGHEYPGVHWSGISDDDPDAGDIKDVWEPSRFGFTLQLGRAFALTNDERYVDQWWKLVESWAAENPPNLGVNWRCAQEASLRAIQLCLGLSLFGDHPASTPERCVLVGRMLSATRSRVGPTLDYALSQRNNHAISELVFLLSLPGQPEPKLCQLLDEALGDQFFDDGSYSQQSLVYQRLATQTLGWLMAVQPELPSRLRQRIELVMASSAGFLERCSDPVSGEMANYGANDGSQLFDLGASNHLALSPTLALLGSGQAARSPLGLKVAPRPSAAPSTYLTMGGERTKLVMRVGQLDRRPGDEDQQSIELFVDGHRLVIDPGTYRYSGKPPWRQPFVGSSVHSTTRPEGADGPATLGRFLRKPMTSAELVWRQERQDVDALVTRRSEQNAVLWRAVVRQGDDFGVCDLVEGAAAVAHWNLAIMSVDSASRFVLEGGTLMEVSCGANVLDRRDDQPGSGWWSPTYGEIQELTAIEVALEPNLPVVTRFSQPRKAGLTEAGVLEVLSASPMADRLRSLEVNA